MKRQLVNVVALLWVALADNAGPIKVRKLLVREL